MRRCLVLLLALCCAAWSLPAAAQAGPDAAYARLASDSYSDIEAGIAGLATSGDPKAGPVLRALTDNRLLYRPDDKALAIKDGATLADARTGAAIAPRWTYLDPQIAFNPLTSFQVIIMALLGGAGRPAGPVVGALFLGLLSELFVIQFRYVYMIVLGVVLIATVLVLRGKLAARAEATSEAAPAVHGS